MQRRKESPKQPQKDDSHMVVTAHKGVVLVVTEKDMYIQNVWSYSMTKKCTKSVKIRPSPKNSNNFWIKNSIWPKLKDKYIKLHPPSDKSPPARIYGLQIIHKANIYFRPIASACGTSP